MPEPSPCPRPPGAPRWVAMVHEAARDSWAPAAQSPYRTPVLYAVGEMTRTVRARGGELTVALWGPEGGDWRLYDVPGEKAPAGRPVARDGKPGPAGPAESRERSETSVPSEPDKLAERMTNRRHQVLTAALSAAGLYDLAPEDGAALRALAGRLDEPTVRRVAHWLAAAAGAGAAG
ncbi:hypothetical protein [Streptomyces malaysiense]|uniref:Uncharacterized protein n=1 Tax=Streptomyces malaysiense TaxID=1428626 RepID=A0A1J4PXN7_9ACTN|nr:hypothetical protein [Streptomyces malaysiense]OIK24592.1 hypothetical protein VT52_026295 [Streptomyces malaysiense]